MTRRAFPGLLLAAALAAGQWLAVAHETEHQALHQVDHACPLCLYAHGAGGMAPPAALHVSLPAAAHAPPIYRVALRAAHLLLNRPIRGPPLLIA